jgi:hypothetical protein
VPPQPPTPPRPVRLPRAASGISDAIAMPPPVRQSQPSRQEQMRLILDALARGEITVTEADKRLAELDRQG